MVFLELTLLLEIPVESEFCVGERGLPDWFKNELFYFPLEEPEIFFFKNEELHEAVEANVLFWSSFLPPHPAALPLKAYYNSALDSKDCVV
jgi:hypothetical protein